MDMKRRVELIEALRALYVEDVDMTPPGAPKKVIVPCYMVPVKLVGEIMQELSE
jgi:hypothetical protein